jgi:hypothetical protein
MVAKHGETMQELKALRQGWDQIHVEETNLLRNLSIMESATQWANLQLTFEPQLQETEALFGSAHREMLAELQSRLQRLVKWQKRHEQSFYNRSDASGPSR